MKKLSLLILALGIGISAALAQDLIVTTSGDSISCKITQERADYVYFTYLKEGVVAKTLIAANQVADKRLDFYDTPVQMAPKATFNRWQYRFQGGYSRRIARISDQVSPYTKHYLTKMKSGYTLGGDLHYFVSEPLGLGAKYGYNHYQYKTASFEDRVKLNYFALSALNRFILKSGNEVYMGGNLGYQSYKEVVATNGNPVQITGGTAGVGLELGYGMMMRDGYKFFINLSMLTGTVTNVTVLNSGIKQKVNLDKGEYESLSRLELTVGLLFGHK